MLNEHVIEKLGFARRRLEELTAILYSENIEHHQQTHQEFFFHLIGAADWLAVLANWRRHLGLPEHRISAGAVLQDLAARGDPLASDFQGLYVNPNTTAFPSDAYSPDGYLYRAYNYRHKVTHRGNNPYHYRLLFEDGIRSTFPKL